MDRNLIMRAIHQAQMNDMRYGIDDCCLWVSGLVIKLGGPDLAEPFRGYTTEEGAAKSLARYAGSDLLRAALHRAEELDLDEASSPFKDGDVGLVINKTGQALGLFFNGAWVARSKNGISFVPEYHAVIAWRVL